MTDSAILSGFHPDPSICRAGDRFYLVTSTFEYAPGVPIFTSTDLTSWEQIGNVLDRPSQLDVRTGVAGASGGIYAPTIRHHDGRFWMTTTNLHEIVRGHLIVHADDPAGPWSEPVYTTGVIGIDPDLAWDDEGRCLLTWSDVQLGGISQVVVEPATGELLSDPVEIWKGTGGAHPEGPHLIRRGDWWYLVVAEGGTAEGHMVTVARSQRPDGPFEANPSNPILTRRSSVTGTQSTGHADLVETESGEWALVHLGTRPRGSFPKWHTNGRETFLAGVDWVDGWPVVDSARYVVASEPTGFVDGFDGDSLHPRWISPGAHPSSFATPGPTGLRLERGREASVAAARRLLATRATDDHWRAEVAAVGDVAFVVRIDDLHQLALERVADRVRVRVVIGPLDQIMATRDGVSAADFLEFRAAPFGGERGARQGPDRLVASVAGEELFAFDGRYLSTQVAGGFTGRVIGVEALGDGVTVSSFRYLPEA